MWRNWYTRTSQKRMEQSLGVRVSPCPQTALEQRSPMPQHSSDYREYFRGKKITLMGLGLLGRGVGDAEFLAQCGADLIVTDLKSEGELASSLAHLRGFPDIRYTLGKHELGDFRDRDLILKAAGVPLDSPYIEEAKKARIPVRMSADLFAEFAQIPIIGVTG